MQNFGVTNKEHYGMLWYFLEWSIIAPFHSTSLHKIEFNVEVNLPCVPESVFDAHASPLIF